MQRQCKEPVVMNLPLRLLKSAANDKPRLELLCMSIIIKTRCKDSLLRDVSVRSVMKMLHCGEKKAKQLLANAKRSTLFAYNPHTNTLLAKNFKKKYIDKKTDKRGRDIYELYVTKLDITDGTTCNGVPAVKDFSLRGLVSELRKLLFLHYINAHNRRKDEFHLKAEYNTSSFISQRAYSQEYFAKKIGVKNRTTLQRLVEELAREGRLSVERHGLEYITNCTSDEALKTLKLSNHRTYVRDRKTGALYGTTTNRYALCQEADKKRFGNIILNHAMRMGDGCYGPKKRTMQDDEMDIMFG